jgi:hypothetical protein
MGLDVYLYDKNRDVIGELGDPHDRLSWLVGTASDLGLHFIAEIDIYDDTMIEQDEYGTLINELETLLSSLNEQRLAQEKEKYLDMFIQPGQSQGIVNALHDRVDQLVFSDLKQHAIQLLKIVELAMQNDDSFICFVGD